MRKVKLSFKELMKQNKEEIVNDTELMKKIEMKIEEKHVFKKQIRKHKIQVV